MASGKSGKSATVRVTATRNLDLMNEGEVATLDRDDRVEALMKGGYLLEVDENDKPLADRQVPAVEVVDSGRSSTEPASGAR